MDDAVLQLLLKRMDKQDDVLGQIRDDGKERMDKQEHVLGEIREHTRETNGRVGRLEIWKAQTDAVKQTYRWVPPVLTSIISGSGSAILIYILSHH